MALPNPLAILGADEEHVAGVERAGNPFNGYSEADPLEVFHQE